MVMGHFALYGFCFEIEWLSAQEQAHNRPGIGLNLGTNKLSGLRMAFLGRLMKALLVNN